MTGAISDVAAQELQLSARNAIAAVVGFLDGHRSEMQKIEWQGREPKARIDRQLNEVIIGTLGNAGVPVLSEEADNSLPWKHHSPLWIVDPLDGTLNFARGVGPSAVSICLWERGGPRFGFVFDISSRSLAWGGKNYGSWGANRLAVSKTDRLSEAVLCSGIPSSFDFSDAVAVSKWAQGLSQFAKIRMIGSAATSLSLVARGSADCYFENEVKIWDVAAGLALVEGAGGTFSLFDGKFPTSVEVFASNATLATMFPKLLNSHQRL